MNLCVFFFIFLFELKICGDSLFYTRFVKRFWDWHKVETEHKEEDEHMPLLIKKNRLNVSEGTYYVPYLNLFFCDLEYQIIQAP